MDLKAFMKGEVPVVEGRGFGGFAEAPPKKPLIAAVEGHALAGGFEAVLACDLVVAAEDAKFGIPEVKRGLVAGAGGLLRLQHRIPRNLASEFALTGDFVGAQRLAELGLINRVTANGGALEGARELATSISANGPLAVRVSKEIMTASDDWSTAEMWDKQNELAGPVFVSHDAMEGAAAFAEKRAPTGRASSPTGAWCEGRSTVVDRPSCCALSGRRPPGPARFRWTPACAFRTASPEPCVPGPPQRP